MFHGLRQTAPEDQSVTGLLKNLLAGLSVGVIALPLAMALAIACGVPPQYGLYTAMVAGGVTALAGGSAVNISGPTAAFVVVLLPIVHKFGLGGLVFSGFLAGILLILMGIGRVGRLVEVVPYPVTLGFTTGIGLVIGALQLADFLGLDTTGVHGHFVEKLIKTLGRLPTLRWQEATVGALTLATLLLWPKMKSRIPGHLVALLVGTFAALALGKGMGAYCATIGSRFHYQVGELTGFGIPPTLPSPAWPWNLPGADGLPMGFSLDLVRNLLGPALTIAILGAIESLLCAVMADGMSGKRHNPNDELIGQGLGNIAGALFGGIPSTAALARTAANIRAGGTFPLAAVVHSGFILLAIILLAPYLAFVPMASMAALLLMVAWNMSEAGHFVRAVRIAPREDVLVLLTCFALTVLFDMVLAVGVGMGLAGLLFIRRNIEMTGIARVEDHAARHAALVGLAPQVVLYDINGPLFFGSAKKALEEMTLVNPGVRVVILDMADVTLLDLSAIMAMESIAGRLQAQGISLVINGLLPRMVLKLRRAGVRKRIGKVEFSRGLEEAAHIAERMLGAA